ncbi:MAG: PKD domain-containing protein [Chitinophagales bacterium]|nr:PKD domain-containing protein [Chitinophagales bacterium]MCB9312595.1 PKD domain-containing protein [Lewinellaceae bacterium]
MSCNANTYEWNFGDGFTSTDKSPSHVYAATGNYVVTLKVTNTCGQDVTSHVVSVVGYPKADFKHLLNPSIACGPTIDSFTNLSNSWSSTAWTITPADTNKWVFTDTLMTLGSKHIKVFFKQPGTYIVQLRAFNICGEDINKDTIEILEPPIVQIKPPPIACDKSVIEPEDLQFVQSGSITSFAWIFTNGSPGSATGTTFPPVTFTSSGTVTLYTESKCGNDTLSVPVTVATTAPISLAGNPSQLCQNDDPVQLQATPPGGQWTGKGPASGAVTPDGLFDPANLAAGMYTLTYSLGSVDCPNSADLNVEILETPFVQMVAPPVGCDKSVVTPQSLQFVHSGSIDTYTWIFTNGSPGGATGPSFSAVTFTSSGTVTLYTTSQCGNDTLSVPIAVSITAPISLAGNPGQLCQNGAPVQLFADPPGGQWTGQGPAASAVTPGGSLDPAGLSPGMYTLTYSLGSVDCPNSADLDLEILPAVGVELLPEGPACDELLYVPNVSYSGTITSYQWLFPGGSPSSSSMSVPGSILYSSPGVYPVEVTVTGACGTAVDSVTLVVQASTPLVIDPLPALICSTSSPFQLTANVPGGTWSGPGITDPVGGWFDPASVPVNQSLTINYGFQDGACQNSTTVTFQVQASESVMVTGGVLCEDSPPFQLSADKPGGVWSGTGISDPSLGIFDATASGIGSFQVTYDWTDPKGCPVSASTTVTVEAFPLISLSDTTLLCLTDMDIDLSSSLDLQVNPPGGSTTWTGPGVIQPSGVFNSSSAGLIPGFYNVGVVYIRNACQVSDTGTIELILNPELSLSPDSAICISENSLVLNANLGNGVWSGPGINAASGLVDLQAAGAGIHVYTYVFEQGSSCEQEGSVTLEIIDPAAGLEAGPDLQVCEGPSSLVLSGFSPAGGSWTGEGVVNGSTGLVDLSGLALDTFYTYTYCLESMIVPGCAACRSRTLRINSRPDIQYQFSGLPCIGEVFSVQNNTTNASSHFWDFGDNATSNLSGPDHSYTQPGTYTLTYIATSSLGCRDTVTQDIFVTTPPIASFSVLVDEGCAPFPVQVNNMSSGYQISQLWLIQEDSISGSDPGNFLIDHIISDTLMTIRLEVTNVCGTRVDEKQVLVHPYPVVDFGLNVDEGCSPLLIDFANVTLGNPETFSWDLGNGQISSNEVPPSQYYTTTDTLVSVYFVTLISTNMCGADTLTKDITVYPPNVNAFIELDTLEGCEPFTIMPKNYSTPGSMVSWVLRNESGQTLQSSNEPHPEFQVSGEGLYQLILYASRCGTDTDTAWFRVLPAPVVSFIHPPYVCEDSPIQFTDESVNTTGYFWEFGDGQVSTDISPNHLYAQSGVYPVNLTAYSLLNNCPATFQSEVLVIGRPVAEFSPGVFQGCSPLKINFQNSSLGTDSLLFIWSFDDGSSSSFDLNPIHSFILPGQYQVSLAAYDAYGCFSDTATGTILVHPDPVANFELSPEQLCHGYDTLHLVNNSVDAVSFSWNIGGVLSTVAEPEVVPQDPGPFTVQLEVQNSFQCRDTLSKTVIVLPSPVADGNPSVNTGCEDLHVIFTNTSLNSDQFLWDLGDQTTSTDMSPSHLYMVPGNFIAQLIAYSSNGCPPDTTRWPVQVFPTPVADFTYTRSHLCGVPLTVNFTNLSKNSMDHDWSFGNGNGADISDPINVYSEIGLFPVSLIESNIFGCRDTVLKWIDVYGQPIADVELPVSIGCQPLHIPLINQSTQALSYQWVIDPDVISDEVEPWIILSDTGVFSIRLIAIYNDLCRDTLDLVDIIRVFQTPIAGFSWQADEDENILGDVIFLNESEQADRYLWDLGDGTQTTTVDVFHEYNINRSIQVMLQAFQDNGGLYTCIDTSLQDIDPEWITTFYAPNAMTPGYGQGDIRVFRPVGIGIQEYDIAVYSPWGELVWHSTELVDHRPSGFWDGSYRGEIVPQGAYAWLARMRFVDGTIRVAKGTVTVLR